MKISTAIAENDKLDRMHGIASLQAGTAVENNPATSMAIFALIQNVTVGRR